MKMFCKNNNKDNKKPWSEQCLLNKLVYNWIFIPLGIAAILVVVILVNQLFKAISFNFPANVASMLLVSILLIVIHYFFPKTIDVVVAALKPAVDFLMSWMIIFFIPPLITIVNSAVFPSGWDIVKLVLVFFIGLLIFIPLVGYTVHYMSILFDGIKKKNQRAKYEKELTSSTEKNNNEKKQKEMTESIKKNFNMVSIVVDSDIEDDRSVTVVSSFDDQISQSSERTYENRIENSDLVMSPLKPIGEVVEIKDITDVVNGNLKPISDPARQLKKDMQKIEKEEKSTEKDNQEGKNTKKSFSRKSSAIPSKHNIITYTVLFILSWIPAIAWDVMQPLHLCINVLAYFGGLCIPDKARVILHPLITCTAFSYVLLWIVGLIFGRSFTEEIDLYSNGSKYLLYFNDTSLPTPAAGEFLFCVLDATVVALSFRIFEHHKLIVAHLFELVGSIVAMSFVSMFVHTLISRAFQIAPLYALSMTSRSATTPLAVQVVDLLGSDMAIAVLIVAFTGVFTDIIGLPLLKLIRFPLKDSLAHGACMGCAGHAVATAGLIKDYPSASAVSSISFVLFSTMCVIWSSIPAFASLFRYVAGI